MSTTLNTKKAQAEQARQELAAAAKQEAASTLGDLLDALTPSDRDLMVAVASDVLSDQPELADSKDTLLEATLEQIADEPEDEIRAERIRATLDGDTGRLTQVVRFARYKDLVEEFGPDDVDSLPDPEGDIADLPRYLTVSLQDGTAALTGADSVEAAERALLDALQGDGKYAWFPETIVDLDTGVQAQIELKLDIAFA